MNHLSYMCYKPVNKMKKKIKTEKIQTFKEFDS